MKKILAISIIALITIGLVTTLHIASAHATTVPVVILFSPSVAPGEGAQIVRSVGGEVTHEFTIINGIAALMPQAGMQVLQKDPRVVSIDPDAIVRAVDSAADTQILADQVWPLGFTGTGVRLAILDTGIDTGHPEFAGRIVACNTEVKGTTTCQDDNGHGTHVAGIAGASGVNPTAKGVAPTVSFMSDKVLDKTGSGTLSQVIAGINWAVTNNARIISMSLGTSPVDGGGTQPNCDTAFPTLTNAVNNAVAKGVTVVAAAGNSGTAGLGAPGCISSAIAVGAVASDDSLADFSSVGVAMTDHGIAAPGVDIFSTFLSGGYATLSGTSMATPMVSGTIALMLSKNPNQTPTTVRSTLFSTADCVQPPCPNINIGHGRVNALNAVNTAPAKGVQPSLSVTPTSTSLVQPGSIVATTTTAVIPEGTGQWTPLLSIVSQVRLEIQSSPRIRN